MNSDVAVDLFHQGGNVPTSEVLASRRTRTKAIDDLAVAHEAELLPGEPLESAVGAAQVQNLLPQLVILGEQAKCVRAERGALLAKSPEMEEPAAAEQR